MYKRPAALFASLLCAVSVFPVVSASPVSWGSSQFLFSPEQQGQRSYEVKALYASGDLSIRQDTTYSPSDRSGQTRVGEKVAAVGCSMGKLRAGAARHFRGARQVGLHVPSRGCAGR